MLYFIILAVMLVMVSLISSRSGLLRNELFSQENLCQIAKAEGIKDPRPAYSLGRTQLAFWTVIIISSFIYAVLANSKTDIHIPAIEGVNLVLLGIAVGTTMVAKVIDGSQMDSQGAIIPQQDHPSKQFLTDIISDEKGVSIHRMQNVIWTLVVGAIYIWYVADHAGLPDEKTITPQLLSLMGISTGAYLGLKTVENKAAPASDIYQNNNNLDPAAATPAVANIPAAGGGSDHDNGYHAGCGQCG
jgi:hypothetical protein